MEPAASMLKKIATNGESINAVDTMRLPPPPQPPASPPAPIWAGGECECSCPCMGSSSDEWDNFSAIDDSVNFEEPERDNSALLAEKPLESKGKLEDKGKRDDEVSATPVDPVRSENVTYTTEDYYPTSIDHTVENSVASSENVSTYETEVSTDMWSCSGTTSLPPEPTILILEGEAPFTIVSLVLFSLSLLSRITLSLRTLLCLFRLRSLLRLLFTREVVKREFTLTCLYCCSYNVLCGSG